MLELVHGGVYFAPDARERFDAVGLRGFWMGYFASRAAALGAVGPEVVTASFYVFNPAMVARAIPDAWARSTPEAVLAARAELADATLRRALGDLADGPEIAEAAAGAAALAANAPLAGRPLAAAHAALPQPAEPLTRLWWAATVLREHRGDGHVAVLLTAGIGPCQALVLAAATGAYGADGAALLRQSRQWPDDAWAAASDHLVERGWLTPGGDLTDAGRAGHQAVEDTTDHLAAAAYTSASDDDLDRLAAALTPIATAIAAAKALPFPNPIGVDV